jgi:hypothetical protein
MKFCMLYLFLLMNSSFSGDYVSVTPLEININTANTKVIWKQKVVAEVTNIISEFPTGNHMFTVEREGLKRAVFVNVLQGEYNVFDVYTTIDYELKINKRVVEKVVLRSVPKDTIRKGVLFKADGDILEVVEVYPYRGEMKLVTLKANQFGVNLKEIDFKVDKLTVAARLGQRYISSGYNLNLEGSRRISDDPEDNKQNGTVEQTVRYIDLVGEYQYFSGDFMITVEPSVNLYSYSDYSTESVINKLVKTKPGHYKQFGFLGWGLRSKVGFKSNSGFEKYLIYGQHFREFELLSNVNIDESYSELGFGFSWDLATNVSIPAEIVVNSLEGGGSAEGSLGFGFYTGVLIQAHKFDYSFYIDGESYFAKELSHGGWDFGFLLRYNFW